MTVSGRNGDGSGVLYRDSKIGNVWNSVVVAAGTAAVAWLGDFDWSAWPAWVATLGVPAAGLIAGLITSKVLPRFKRPA